jgi:hypothetical protein
MPPAPTIATFNLLLAEAPGWPIEKRGKTKAPETAAAVWIKDLREMEFIRDSYFSIVVMKYKKRPIAVYKAGET